MTGATRRNRVKELFQAALAQDPRQRGVFLGVECDGDLALQAEVESLLAAHYDAGGLVERPAIEASDGPPASTAAHPSGPATRVLNRGDRLGPYEILECIGAGGMGEVYRAKDARLRRDVAVKVLLHAANTDPERRRRFTQEAVAAGSLNHPHIVAVLDVGVEGDTPYLVSELIEGILLRQELERGRTSLRRMLEIGSQIAEGLAAAHAAGLVHRDLKPENVMITREGRVKILDFGLAKTAPGAEQLSADAGTKTITAAGLVVGTVPYMSPEQAKGTHVDFRSDQFALGIILYELATDTHPFRRDTAVQTLAAVIAEEPPDLTHTRPDLPVPVRWLIRRLLAKNPIERYAHTSDVAADLRTIRENLAEVLPSGMDPVAVATRRRWLLIVAGASLVIAVTSFGIGRVLGLSGASVTAHRFTSFATDAGYQGAPAWSPDGKTMAYVAEDAGGVLQVFTKSVGSSARHQVTRSRFDCHDPFWSPDGGLIYYHSLARDREALWRVSPTGGAPDTIIEGAVSGAISPDGRTLAVTRDESLGGRRRTLWLSSPPGAEPTQYARAPFTAFSEAILRFSPDGTRLLVWVQGMSDGMPDTPTGFFAISFPGGEPRPILPSLAGPRSPPLFSWMPDSRRIVFVDNEGSSPGFHLWLADTRTGDTRPLTTTHGNEGFPAVSPDGRRVAFTSEMTDFDLVEVPLDGSAPHTLLSSTRNEFDPVWSPDGSQYAYVTDQNGDHEIWLRSAAGDWQQSLVTQENFSDPRTMAFGSPAFSPNGDVLAYQRFSGEGYRIWLSTRAGGLAQRLIDDPRYQDAPTWSPDGEWIAFVMGGAFDVADNWVVAKVRVGAGGGQVVTLKRGVMPFSRPKWSPDGRRILAQSPEGLVLIDSDGKGETTVSEASWLSYAWKADGRIYGLQPTESLHRFMLVVLDPATGNERVLNPDLGAIPQASAPIRGFSLLGDRGFLTSIARVRSDIWLLEGFQTDTSPWARFWQFARPGPAQR